MPQETLGYVNLEWTCPKCRSRNPGTEKVCVSCGAAQPEDVQFEQVESQQASQDEKLKKIAEAGADVHCAFCGTRNPADAKVCSQCGADLKDAPKRKKGQVVGAYQPKPVKQIACPNCKTMNPETALKCSGCGAPLSKEIKEETAPSAPLQPSLMSKKLVFVLISGLVVLCICGVIGYIWLSSPRESQNAVIQNVEWKTSVAIEELGPATYQTWMDEVPQDSELGNCTDRVRYTQDQEPFGGNYNKVCGTPYTVDTGSGVGQVVQDCVFEVLEPYCEYTKQEWQVIDQVSQTGNDFSPVFPNPQLGFNQRLGQESSTYIVIFETDEGRYTYPVANLDEFQEYLIGTRWILNINGLGQIVSVEPEK